MAVCRGCKSKSLDSDGVTGDTICSNCGLVQDFDNYQHQTFSIAGPLGTSVRLGTVGSGTNYSYREQKLYSSNYTIEDVTFRLNMTGARTREIKIMIDKITEGEFGSGDWFQVLVGACCYVVMRNNNKSLPITEVVEAVGCELYEMGKMVRKVVDFLDLRLPEFDVVALLERTIRGYSGFRGIDEDRVKLMIEQGNFVIQCAIKWFLTTGRRPGPVAVSVLVFVAELNGIMVRIEDVAKEMNWAVSTSRLRYKELLQAFVEVAQGLPWGKDVNVKNILKSALFVMKYMETKSSENKGTKRKRGFGEESDGINLGDVVGECLSRELECGNDTVENHLKSSTTAEDQDGNELENLKVSSVDLARIYSKFKTDITSHDLMKGNEEHRRRSKLSGEKHELFDEWWCGRSDLCKKLLLQQLVEKDVGFDALPPSYIRGRLADKRRQEKIRAAKTRINSIICSSNDSSNGRIRHSSLKTEKRKKQCDDLDWEDFIIETLLLHQVKEVEIEKGYYKALLGLHVFNSGVV